MKVEKVNTIFHTIIEAVSNVTDIQCSIIYFEGMSIRTNSGERMDFVKNSLAKSSALSLEVKMISSPQTRRWMPDVERF